MDVTKVSSSNYDQHEYSQGQLEYYRAKSTADSFVHDLRLPAYRKLVFHDDTGLRYILESFMSDYRVPGHHDSSMRNTLVIHWNTPREIGTFFTANPQLLAEYEKRKKLKPDRVPNPFDGIVHSIEIWFSKDDGPRIKLDYTSAVWISGPKPAMNETDIMYHGYCDIHSTLWIPLSDIGYHPNDYRLML